MHDVVVIGAGPAGLQAARQLSSRNLDVVVLEEHALVGHPVHCTGILARSAFQEFDLPKDTILGGLDTARFRSPGGRDVVYHPERLEAVVVDRALFDLRLADCAVAAGATLRCGARAIDLRIDADSVSIDVAGAVPIRARTCILACGARYGLHRRLALERPRLLLQSAQAEVPAARPGDVEIHFGSESAPKGFGWAVPVVRGTRSFARIGVMCATDAPQYFQRLMDHVGTRWGLDTRAAPPPLLKVLPLSVVPRTYGDRLLLIGDAAGIVKATTGGGIYYSLLTATIAADVMAAALASGDVQAESLAEYERLWREYLGAELAAQRSLRAAAQKMSDADIEGLFELALTDGIMPIVRQFATFNRHRELILELFKHPPARKFFFGSMVS